MASDKLYKEIIVGALEVAKMKRYGEVKHINEIENDIDKDKAISLNRGRKAKLCSDAEAESGAERYAKLLNAPECKLFFMKVMYHLPYDTRERILASATRPGILAPKNYFTYSAKRELARFGF